MFTVSLSKDQFRVEPGNAATLTLLAVNQGNEPDRYEIEVSGLDQEWVALPIASFVLTPGEERTEKVLIKPPRTAESKAGVYPFAIRLRSLESGEAVEIPAVLEVEPFNLISVEVEPKRATATYFKKQVPFGVTTVNLGNTDLNLQLFADDPEDACTYQFQHERVQLAPGQQKTTYVAVQPTQFPIVGSPRLFGFAVTARSTENLHLGSNAQAQLERRALFTPAFFLVTIIILALIGFWYAMRPQAPTMVYFSANPTIVEKGQMVTLSWKAAHAKSVTITAGDKTWSGLKDNDEMQVQINETTTFFAYAVNDLGQSERAMTVSVEAKEPLQILLPEIDSFSVSPKEVFLGDPVTVKYKVKNATRIQLQPFGIDLPINLDSIELRPDQPGVQEITLLALNIKNEATRQTVKINVKEKSNAKILDFSATLDGQKIGEAPIPYGSSIILSWRSAGGTRAEILPGIGTVTPEQGQMEIPLEKTTTFTLTIYDESDRPAVKKLVINVSPPPETPPSPDPDR
jgi:hypothetical protein